MGAFHAYDIRGIYNVNFDRTLAFKAGYFIPQLLDADRVVVGRDVRVSSPEIHDALVEGITSAGADVYDLGLSTTPLVYYATASKGFKASVQITASHNPKEYNGMKISRENALPVGLDTGLEKIRDWVEEGRPTPPASKPGKVYGLDIREEYVNFLKKNLGDYSNLRIGMDLSNGMAGLFARKLFGDGPIYLYEDLDGSFPNHEANPLMPENVVDLQRLVVDNKCDVGVIFDGDADRVMFVDERGTFISPDLIIALMGKYFVEKRGERGIVLQDIRSSKSVAEFLEPLGCRVETWRVGRAFAAPKLRDIGGLWGGELAGHYYFRDFFYSDSGLLASMIVLNIVSDLKREGKTISETIAGISHYFNSGEINFKIEHKAKAMDALKEHFCNEETAAASYDFDGYRIEFDDWWFNVRPSNTEPYLRFICEASSAAKLEKKVSEAKAVLRKYIQ